MTSSLAQPECAHTQQSERESAEASATSGVAAPARDTDAVDKSIVVAVVIAGVTMTIVVPIGLIGIGRVRTIVEHVRHAIAVAIGQANAVTGAEVLLALGSAGAVLTIWLLG